MLGKPGRAFLGSGEGRGGTELAAFDAALLDAGVGDGNLVTVSSVLPAGCEVVEPWPVEDGELLPCVVAKETGSGVLEAAVAAALSDGMGMVAEASGSGAEEEARRAAVEMVESRGLEVTEVLTEASIVEAREPAAAVAVLAFGIDF